MGFAESIRLDYSFRVSMHRRHDGACAFARRVETSITPNGDRVDIARREDIYRRISLSTSNSADLRMQRFNGACLTWQHDLPLVTSCDCKGVMVPPTWSSSSSVKGVTTGASPFGWRTRFETRLVIGYSRSCLCGVVYRCKNLIRILLEFCVGQKLSVLALQYQGTNKK